MSKPVVRLVAVVAAIAVVVGGAAAAYAGISARNEAASSANGTGLTFEGRFYWASSDEVAPAALGAAVADDVLFQDRTADLRAIDGFAPDVALAALLPSLDGSPGGDRWTFVSTDKDRGTNPTAYADSAAVLLPDD